MEETTVVTTEPTVEVTPTETKPLETKPVEDVNHEPSQDVSELQRQLKKLQEELVKEKNKSDTFAKEAAENRKALRATKSAEEQRAEEEKERQEAIEAELKSLRKQSAMANISKKVLTFVGDEEVSNTVAEYLYGAEDIDAAITAINKAWVAKEKKLRMEYGKIPAPGKSAEEEKREKNIEMAKAIGQRKANAIQSTKDGLSKFMIR